jgi:IPT/TIG domain
MMTKRTRALHWGRLFAAGLLTVFGVAGCGRGPTAPSQPELRNPAATILPAPTILSVTPSIGSTGGGASIKITGAGLLPGIRVTFGATIMAGWFDKYSGGVFVSTPSHAPGSVDVVVTNVDGQNDVAIGAYTFAPPESFDVNGNWRGVSFAGDYDEPFTFTVVNGAVVSITCATSGLVGLSPPAPIIHGEFSYGGEEGVAISGRIVAPNEALGVVNVGPVGNVRPCVGAEWHAIKE